MKQQYVALSIALIVISQNFAMEQSTQSNKILCAGKKESSSFLKKTYEIFRPTPAQQRIMFSMLLMTGMFALSQAAVEQLPACIDLLKGNVDPWFFSSPYNDLQETTATNQGCVDLCQLRQSDGPVKYGMVFPENTYVAKCYNPPLNVLEKCDYEVILDGDEHESKMLAYQSATGPLFPIK